MYLTQIQSALCPDFQFVSSKSAFLTDQMQFSSKESGNFYFSRCPWFHNLRTVWSFLNCLQSNFAKGGYILVIFYAIYACSRTKIDNPNQDVGKLQVVNHDLSFLPVGLVRL